MAGWQLTICGETFRSGELTIPLAERIEDATGLDWRDIQPLHSAKVARHMAAVFLSDRLGLTMADAYGKVEGVTVDEWVDSIQPYADLPEAYDEGVPSSADEG